jgi:hypothetical protein
MSEPNNATSSGEEEQTTEYWVIEDPEVRGVRPYPEHIFPSDEDAISYCNDEQYNWIWFDETPVAGGVDAIIVEVTRHNA